MQVRSLVTSASCRWSPTFSCHRQTFIILNFSLLIWNQDSLHLCWLIPGQLKNLNQHLVASNDISQTLLLLSLLVCSFCTGLFKPSMQILPYKRLWCEWNDLISVNYCFLCCSATELWYTFWECAYRRMFSLMLVHSNIIFMSSVRVCMCEAYSKVSPTVINVDNDNK